MTIVFLILAFFLVLGMAERRNHVRHLSRIPIRILVNGTRGKTTLTRILTKALNEAGIPTLGRSTGSEAAYLYPDGSVVPFPRKHGARITEMKEIFRKADELHVKAVVIECMALKEENQRLMRDILVKPTLLCITNAYVDHIVEMGATEAETREVLLESLPKDTPCFTTDPHFSNIPNVTTVPVTSWNRQQNPLPIHDETLSLAVATGRKLGLTEAQVLHASDTLTPDIGLIGEIKGRNGARLIPSFSINDQHCMQEAIEQWANETDKLHLIYNNRSDREYRLPLFKELLEGLPNDYVSIHCIGDYPKKVARYFAHGTLASRPEELAKQIQKAGPDEVFLGLGNIAGGGKELIDLMRKEEPTCSM